VTEEPALAKDDPSPQLSVVVPAYNEERRIGQSLRRMIGYFASQPYRTEILVVDDGSTDGTAERVREIAAGRSDLTLLSYAGNRGKGYAVRFGMLRASGDFVLFSDADLATPIEEVEKLMAAVRAGADIAIGSRDVPGALLERRQSAIREMGGKLFNRFVQVLAVPGIHDTQCGFKLFTRAAAQNIFSRCRIDNFSFDVEALFLGRRLGYVIAEVPIRWAHQEGSKVRFVRDALRMVKTLFRIRATDYELRKADAKRSIVP
jgi:dolichyl-phosphate beta-glucosyltransferase